ncbi:MAG: PAS domain-containing protein [Pararheinheimera sp.]|nr:PAS domain-containing protein [Rheinheimera sp.]
MLPFTANQVQSVLSKILDCNHPDIVQLSRDVFKKAKGVPAQIKFLLNYLAQNNIITRNHQNEMMLIDKVRVTNFECSEVFYKDILNTFCKIPEHAQKLLKYLSVMDKYVDIEMLLEILGVDHSQFDNLILPTLPVDWLFKSDSRYTYRQNSVRLIINCSIEGQEYKNIMLQVGRCWLSKAYISGNKKYIVRALKYLIQVPELVTQEKQAEVIVTAAVNAAMKAKASHALKFSQKCFNLAHHLLTGDPTGYQILANDIKLELAADALQRGELNKCLQWLDSSWDCFNSSVQKGQASCIKLEALIRIGQTHDALDFGLEELKRYGLSLSGLVSDEQCDAAFNAVSMQLAELGEDYFLLAVHSCETQVDVQCQLMVMLLHPAGIISPNFRFLLVCHILELSLLYGISSSMFVALSWFSVLIGHKYQQYEQGKKYCLLVKSLVEHQQFEHDSAKVWLALSLQSCWSNSFDCSLDFVEKGVNKAQAQDDLISGAYLSCNRFNILYVQGQHLRTLLLTSEQNLIYRQKLSRSEISEVFFLQQSFVQALQCLDGEKFCGEFFTEVIEAITVNKTVTAYSENAVYPAVSFYYWFYKGVLQYIATEFSEACSSFEKASDLAWIMPGHIYLFELEFYYALALSACYQSNQHSEVTKPLLLCCIEKVRSWASLNPENFSNKALILNAELKKIEGDFFTAMELFEQVISTSKDGEFLQYKALAHELAGRLAFEFNQFTSAKAHLNYALHYYNCWGSKGKVKQMRERYVQLQLEGTNQPYIQATTSYLTHSVSEKSVSAILNSIEFDKESEYLLRDLIRAALEDSQAQRCALVSLANSVPRLLMRGEMSEGEIRVDNVHQDIDAYAFPFSLLANTVKGKQLLHVRDLRSPPYDLDPYLQVCPFDEVISVPVLCRGETIGILYLEYKGIHDSHDDRQISLLIFLTAQISRCIENLRLQKAAEDAIASKQAAEKSLKVSIASQALSEEIGQIGGWRWEFAENVIHCSEQYGRIFGLEPGSKVISFETYCSVVHPDDIKAINASLYQSIAHQKPIRTEYRLLKPDGSITYILGIGKPTLVEGKFIGYIGLILDVTERKVAENTLRLAQNDLARYSRISTVGQLTSSIAHEINQPLMSIVANAGAGLRWLHRNTPDLQHVSASLQAIATEGQRAGEIVQSLRALTKNTKAVIVVLDIHDVLNHILAIARSEIERRHVSLVLHLDAQWSDILGDMPRVLTISTFTEEDQAIFIRVEDTGPGISEETKARLFDAFYTTKKDGMGMGLTICQSIVEMHGGKLSAAARQPVGTVFSFFMPLVKD